MKSSSVSICNACIKAADQGKFGKKAHSGCTGRGRCCCQHSAEGRYLPGYPKVATEVESPTS